MTEEKQPTQYAGGAYNEDEISLVDLWLVMVRRKWLIMGIAFLCLALGVASALMREPVYGFTTVVELGRMGDAKPVEATDSAAARIGRIAVPIVRSEMLMLQTEADQRPPEVNVRRPSGGAHLLEFGSEGTMERQEEILRLHERLLNWIKTDHDDLAERDKKRLELEKRTVQDEMNRIETEKKRIQQRITETRSRLTTGRILQGKAPDEATDEAQAMTLLIIQSQIEDAHRQLSDLEEELYKRIPSREDRLDIRMAEIENQLDRIYLTKVHAKALASEYPVSTGKRLVVALSLVLGVMLGVFGAFFAEFLSGARVAAAKRQDQDV